MFQIKRWPCSIGCPFCWEEQEGLKKKKAPMSRRFFCYLTCAQTLPRAVLFCSTLLSFGSGCCCCVILTAEAVFEHAVSVVVLCTVSSASSSNTPRCTIPRVQASQEKKKGLRKVPELILYIFYIHKCYIYNMNVHNYYKWLKIVYISYMRIWRREGFAKTVHSGYKDNLYSTLHEYSLFHVMKYCNMELK